MAMYYHRFTLTRYSLLASLHWIHRSTNHRSVNGAKDVGPPWSNLKLYKNSMNWDRLCVLLIFIFKWKGGNFLYTNEIGSRYKKCSGLNHGVWGQCDEKSIKAIPRNAFLPATVPTRIEKNAHGFFKRFSWTWITSLQRTKITLVIVA